MKKYSLQKTISNALNEDIGRGDITSKAFIPSRIQASAVIISKQQAILCGIDVARAVFKTLDSKINVKSKYRDGDSIKPGNRIIEVSGSALAILSAERTALNFLSHLSGIASEAKKFINRIKPYKAKILDTRKTTPGLRILEKNAVKCAGGYNHRVGLWDRILIKDNHKAIMRHQHIKYGISKLIQIAKSKNKLVEIEVENLREFKEALAYKADIIMLDNMSLREIKKAVSLRKAKRPFIETSGNINLNNVRAIAKAGVDFISIGSITHSPKAIDFSLKII